MIRRGFPEIATCTLAWGSIGVIVKNVTLGAAPIVFFRLSLGMLVVLAWLAWRKRLHTLRPDRRPVLLVLSGCVLAAHWVTLFEGFKRLDVAPTILIVFLGPVLMAVGAPFVLRERLRPVAVLALALAFGGIALITVPDISGIDGVGVASALASAVLFAVLLLVGKLLAPHYAPSVLVVWQLGVAAVLVSPALASASAAQIGRAFPLLLLLGSGFTGLLGILFWRAIGALEAQQLGVMFYLEPASAVLYAWWLLAEQPTALTLAGGALVVAAGLVIIFGDRTAVGGPSGLPEPIPAKEIST